MAVLSGTTQSGGAVRLWQARELIRVVVQTHPAKDAPTRVYVSWPMTAVTTAAAIAPSTRCCARKP